MNDRGEAITRRAEVRIIVATNADLEKRVAEGRFREDLFYRLNGINLLLPPLWERPEDLLTLAAFTFLHSITPGNLSLDPLSLYHLIPPIGGSRSRTRPRNPRPKGPKNILAVEISLTRWYLV